MKFKEFLGSGPAGIVAGVVTVVLGGGAVAALAFGSPAAKKRPMGDSRLSAGNQAFEAALVANAGANVVGEPNGSGREMADGSPVAGPAAAARRAAASAAASNGSSAQARRSSAGNAPARPGSAEYYRALLQSGSGGMGSLAMLPRGAMGRGTAGGNLAGDLTGANAADYTRDRPATVVRDPLVPSRAFSNYGTNDAGSSSVGSSRPAAGTSRPAVGTSPVGPVSNKGGSSSARPASSAPSVAPIVAPPSSAASHNPNSSAGSPAQAPLVASPPPSATDPLGEHRAPSSPGNAAHQPDTPTGSTPGTTPPGTKPAPPTTSVVGPDAIVTPEPGTWLLVGSGLLALGLFGRRRAGRVG